MSRVVMILSVCTLSLGVLSACKGEEEEDDTGSEDGGSASDGGGEASDGGGEAGDGGGAGDGGSNTDMPEAPAPFTLQVSGARNQALYFDTITCSKPVGSNNFRVFWRDSTGSHVFVLAAELLGTYTEPGTYTTAEHSAKVKLQEEAGGTGDYAYYATDSGRGDSATIVVEFLDEEKLEVAWGSFEFSGLHDTSGGGITATPQPLPIWCSSLN